MTCTALSAPIDSALRMVSTAFSGPIDRTVTSPPCASLILSASSTAYSSSSFMTPSTLSRSTVLSEPSFFSAHVSGTCFTQTTMFMAGGRPPDQEKHLGDRLKEGRMHARCLDKRVAADVTHR